MLLGVAGCCWVLRVVLGRGLGGMSIMSIKSIMSIIKMTIKNETHHMVRLGARSAVRTTKITKPAPRK